MAKVTNRISLGVTEEQEEEISEEKIINEGNDWRPSFENRLDSNPCATRIQNMEEKRALPLRYDLEHSIRMAYPYYPVASR